MKARLFSLVLLLTLGSAACAQVRQSKPRWSIDLLAGPAFHVGKYAGGDQPDGDNGAIKAGGLLELSGTYHINHRLGIVLLADGQINKIKNQIYFGVLTTSGGVEPSPSPYNDHWKIARLLTGGVYTLPLNKNKKLDLLVRALGGIQKTKTGGYEDMAVAGFYSPFASQTLPWAFAYEGDLGLKWHSHGSLSLIAYGGYNGSISFAHLKQPPYPTALTTSGYTTVVYKASFPTGSLLFRSGVSLDL